METEKYNLYFKNPAKIQESIIKDKREKRYLVTTIDPCQMCNVCTYETGTIIM